MHLSSVRVTTNLIITISPLSLLGQIEEILLSVSGGGFFLFSYVTFILSQTPPSLGWESLSPAFVSFSLSLSLSTR